MAKITKDFKIDQLQKDKIIYATEACAVALVAIVVMMFSDKYLLGPAQIIVDYLCLATAVGYATYMGVGNFIRLKKIKKLE